MNHVAIWPRLLMTPVHVHGVRGVAEYRAAQRAFISRNRVARPGLHWRDPWVSPDTPAVIVSGGKWIVKCACGNGPSVAPRAGIALCFECGAIYRHLVMPAKAMAIALALCARPHPAMRHWAPQESVTDLLVENAELQARGLMDVSDILEAAAVADDPSSEGGDL